MTDLPAGRELDFAVHEIMTGERRPYAEHRAGSVPTDWELSCPRYSNDIAAAWTVVEKLRSLGFGVVIDNLPSTSGRDVGWTVAVVGISTQDAFAGTAHTAPLAICRAALSAVKANP